MKFPRVMLAMVAAGLFSACQNVMDRRIAAHATVWRGLSAQDQQRLRQGHVFPGDTEDMVRIALGPPDKVLPFTSQKGQAQTVWLYDLLEFESGYDPYNPISTAAHLTSRERSVVFQEGIVVNRFQAGAERGMPELAAERARQTAEVMTERLHALVTLTAGQKLKAREIFHEANDELFALPVDERPVEGMPIRVKMRADIRSLLTPAQQSVYDAAPQYLGGGSMKKPH